MWELRACALCNCAETNVRRDHRGSRGMRHCAALGRCARAFGERKVRFFLRCSRCSFAFSAHASVMDRTQCSTQLDVAAIHHIFLSSLFSLFFFLLPLLPLSRSMCRWLVYKGDTVRLDALLTRSANAIVAQTQRRHGVDGRAVSLGSFLPFVTSSPHFCEVSCGRRLRAKRCALRAKRCLCVAHRVIKSLRRLRSSSATMRQTATGLGACGTYACSLRC